MAPITLFLIDQHEVVRVQLGLRLEREPDFKVVGQASSCECALKAIIETKPDIVIMDPVNRDGTCLDSLRKIADMNPGMLLVVLTAIPDTLLQLELRRVGVHKVLMKGIETEILLDELRGLVANSFAHR